MKKLLYFLALIPFALGCKKQLVNGNNQQPFDRLSPTTVFNSENDLQLYVNSFYNILPTADAITHGDAMSDYAARNVPPSYLIPGAYSSQTAGGWTWGKFAQYKLFLNKRTASGKKSGYPG